MNLFRNFTIRDWLIFSGNLCMLITSLLYIAWWASAFYPASECAPPVSSFLLLLTCLTGIAAVILFICGIRIPLSSVQMVPTRRILFSAVILYIVLLCISIFLFHRPVTSELFIMMLWAAGELCALSILYSAGRFGIKSVIVLKLLIFGATAAGYICYLNYYLLEGIRAFIDGLIPLALDGAVVAVFLILHVVM